MIYKLDEITKKDVQEVGGKAANLGELIKFGFNVPKGFVCTAKENKNNRSENIKGYINEKNIVDDNTKVSVIVQEMIDGDISGVMFTKDPVSGDDTIIIESVLGLGEKLVQGEVTPAQIIINKNTLTMENKVGIKMLSNNEIELLSKIGLELERFFKAPQDIEWSLKDGKIYILQTRNITTL